MQTTVPDNDKTIKKKKKSQLVSLLKALDIEKETPVLVYLKLFRLSGKDGGNIGGSGVHFPSTPGKYLADLRSRANSQQYSSIYEDQRPKIEDIERSDGKKSAQGQ